MTWRLVLALAAVCGGCRDPAEPLQTAQPGVVFTFPVDQQLDVPTGARVLVTFSDPVEASALGACTADNGAVCLVGPSGVVDATPVVIGDGKTVELTELELDAGTEYELFVRSPIAPTATNLPASGPLVSFTTRSSRPRAAPPALVAINGSPVATPTSFRPMFETSTIRLVFSEPLDPRTVVMAASAVELVDANNAAVPATLLANGIHVSIDPADDLAAGTSYSLKLGNALRDLGGQQLSPQTIALAPVNSRGTTPVSQVLRTRGEGDPGPETSRAGGVTNVIAIDKPLIGKESSALLPVALQAEMGDATILGGPIAFVLRKGQRLSATGLEIKLGGELPVGLSTGDIQIELLSDAGGRLYRNPHQPPDQRPENERAPLYVDLSLDVAVYAKDPKGNAVMAQTILGVQGLGTAQATEGVLAIENVASMEIALLGVTVAPSNMTLELITDPSATPESDTVAPTIVATSPDLGDTQPVDGGIEVIFSEPVDIDRIRAGGMRLETGTNTVVPVVYESHGSTIVIRPLARLAYSTSYRLVMGDIADVAGNALAMGQTMAFSTPRFVNTGVPMTITGVYPGVPCSLTGATATRPGRCSGSNGNDDLYHPFTIRKHDNVHIAFSQTITTSSITHGTACGQGSVRIEALDAAGTCTGVVAGTLLRRDRALEFVPDVPWTEGARYRLSVISGDNNTCNANELCGNGAAVNLDPLGGAESGDGGGPANMIIPFVGAPATKGTFMLAHSGPYTDVNGSGFVDTGEVLADDNRAGMAILGTDGAISAASFSGPDCIPSMPGTQACMYLLGDMPVTMGELQRNCALPGGLSAASCVPVTMSPQAMLATNISMNATVVISIGTDTGTSVMRIREPATGPVMGYIYDDAGTPTLIAQLDLYMDAPDMSIALNLASHDLHSKPLALTLKGPVTFLPDGRIAISAANTADLPVTVNITSLVADGAVRMVVPAGEMKLRLVSPMLRGVSR
ncbi:MAG: Ig-like domain-containing protein [Kofleriaceae bacterium]